MNENLKKYTAPVIEVFEIELEKGIAATSQATLTPTGTSPFQPDVEDWVNESETQQSYF